MRLKEEFFARDTREVARDLLGKVLVYQSFAGRIVETEAYLGPEDLASHARFKSRKRNYLMFGPPGRLYVYFTYGMYYMLNIVAKEEGKAGAVLIRGLEPLTKVRGKMDGPGKITRELGITKEHSGLLITSEELHMKEGPKVLKIKETPRIGIDYAGEYKDKLWRFVIERDASYKHLSENISKMIEEST